MEPDILGRRIPSSWARFMAVGSVGTIAYVALVIVLQWVANLQVANAIALVISTVLTSGLHRSYTFRAGLGSNRVRVQAAGMAVLIASLLLTSAALALLPSIDFDPSSLTVASTLVCASGLTTVLRYRAIQRSVVGSPVRA